MKILVVFGSSSDERIYAPFVENMGKKHDVRMEVLSAHRNPDELGELLISADYDCVCAGAGIAAHLPGVVASKITKPVFGIPVDGNFGGLDAFLSIVQMPFGVPVASVGPNKELEIGTFLDSLTPELFKEKVIEVYIDKNIQEYEYVHMELSRAEKFAQELGYKIRIVEEVTGRRPAVVYVNGEKDVHNKGPCMNIPIMDKNVKMSPYKAATFMDWSMNGGLWCGVNNSRNAIKFWNQWEKIITNS